MEAMLTDLIIGALLVSVTKKSDFAIGRNDTFDLDTEFIVGALLLPVMEWVEVRFIVISWFVHFVNYYY